MQAINKEKLKQMNEQDRQDFVLLNVLPPDEFNAKHIRTAVNVPVNHPDFLTVVETVAGHKGRPIVVHCKNADCDASRKAAKTLDAAGFQHIYEYEGGTEDWFHTSAAA